MSNSAVSVKGVSKKFRLYHERATTLKERLINWRKPSYEEFWALNDVSVEIGHGETAGLIGPNGSGKSTLLKVIAGVMRPDAGTITTTGRIASLLELGAGFHPDLTGRENVYMNASILGLTRKQTDKYFDSIVAFSELEKFVDQQVRHYSSGMYVRLGFAVAVHVDPEILLVDEVLSVGDEAFQRKCMDRIRSFQMEGRTIIFVTHAVDTARTLCNRVHFLHKGALEASGSPADVIKKFRMSIHTEAPLDQGPTEEHGTQQIRIRDMKFIDGLGNERQIYSPGEPMEIRVMLEADEPVHDPVVGFGLYDERHVHVFGTNTMLRDLPLGTIRGQTEISFRISSIPVLDGEISVSSGVVTRDETQIYHWREKAWKFRVVNAGSDVGTVMFPVEISVQKVAI